MSETILLMGHGSRDREGALEFLELVDAVRTAVTPRPVEGGFLEFAGPAVPSIQEALDSAVARGTRRVLAVPVLLFQAGHAKHDMPREIACGRVRYPEVDFRLAPPLGLDQSLLQIIEERIAQVQSRLGPTSAGETAVLLVGRGTSDREANADFFKIGRLVWEHCHYNLVECCFVSLAEPEVPAGIHRCVRLGARRILVIPYFINTGILVKRIKTQALAAQERYPGIEIAVGEHFGVHPKLVQLILTRAAALAGRSVEPYATLPGLYNINRLLPGRRDEDSSPDPC